MIVKKHTLFYYYDYSNHVYLSYILRMYTETKNNDNSTDVVEKIFNGFWLHRT